MASATTSTAYEDCYELLDRALESDTGIRAQMDDGGAAYQLRMRLHYARKLSRQESTQIFPDPNHPEHGRSAYDNLVVSLREVEGKWWIFITPRKPPTVVENISDHNGAQ